MHASRAPVILSRRGAVLLCCRSGACAREFDLFCATSMPGLGRFAQCLSSRLGEEANGNVEGEQHLGIAAPCPFLSLPYPTPLTLPLSGSGLALHFKHFSVKLCVAGQS